MLTGICKDRYKRQHEVLVDASRHFAVLMGYSEGRPPFEPYAIEGQSGTLSEEFLDKHAYDLGVQAATNCEGAIIAPHVRMKARADGAWRFAHQEAWQKAGSGRQRIGHETPRHYRLHQQVRRQSSSVECKCSIALPGALDWIAAPQVV